MKVSSAETTDSKSPSLYWPWIVLWSRVSGMEGRVTPVPAARRGREAANRLKMRKMTGDFGLESMESSRKGRPDIRYSFGRRSYPACIKKCLLATGPQGGG